MSKPTSLSRWAETAGGTPDANIVEPTSGHKDTGYELGEEPTSGNANWLFWVIYLWLKFLDGFFTADGAFSTPAGQGITSGAGFTATANSHVTVSGTGEFKHGELTIVLSGAVAQQYEGGAQQWVYFDSVAGLAAQWGTPSGASADIVFPINLKIGDRIKQLKAWIQDDNTAGHTVAMYFHKSVASDMLAGGSQIGATQTSAHDGTVQALTLSGLTTTVASGNAYEVVLRSGAAGTMRIMSLEVTYDRP